MGAVTYPDQAVVNFVGNNLIAVQLLSDSKPYADDFNVRWTPTVILLDENGKEHHRLVGFLPPSDFIPEMLLGIAKMKFNQDDFDGALLDFEKILSNYPQSKAAPETMYLRGVSRYKNTHDAKYLKEAYEQLRHAHPNSEWTQRAQPYSLL